MILIAGVAPVLVKLSVRATLLPVSVPPLTTSTAAASCRVTVPATARLPTWAIELPAWPSVSVPARLPSSRGTRAITATPSVRQSGNSSVARS